MQNNHITTNLVYIPVLSSRKQRKLVGLVGALAIAVSALLTIHFMVSLSTTRFESWCMAFIGIVFEFSKIVFLPAGLEMISRDLDRGYAYIAASVIAIALSIISSVGFMTVADHHAAETAHITSDSYKNAKSDATVLEQQISAAIELQKNQTENNYLTKAAITGKNIERLQEKLKAAHDKQENKSKDKTTDNGGLLFENLSSLSGLEADVVKLISIFLISSLTEYLASLLLSLAGFRCPIDFVVKDINGGIVDNKNIHSPATNKLDDSFTPPPNPSGGLPHPEIKRHEEFLEKINTSLGHLIDKINNNIPHSIVAENNKNYLNNNPVSLPTQVGKSTHVGRENIPSDLPTKVEKNYLRRWSKSTCAGRENLPVQVDKVPENVYKFSDLLKKKNNKEVTPGIKDTCITEGKNSSFKKACAVIKKGKKSGVKLTVEGFKDAFNLGQNVAYRWRSEMVKAGLIINREGRYFYPEEINNNNAVFKQLK